jgi:tetratricopeptide (TPR) repeat protein
MAQQVKPGNKIALAPLLGREQTGEAHWLGALLGKLLAEHLDGAKLPVLPYNTVARQIKAGKHRLPLEEAAVEALRRDLKLGALIHGRYVLDEDSDMLALHLLVEAPNVPRTPLEAASPLAGFARFIERVSLALVEKLGVPIDDALREQVRAVRRPARFEAFRQLARAHLAWSEGQNELALTAITSALTLDPDLDEAAALEVAIARTAEDTATAQEAFRRWADIARKQKRPLAAGERLTMLGHWLAGRGEWSDARDAYEDARDLFQREANEPGKAQALNNLAGLDLMRGKVQTAIKTYRRSLRTFEADPGAQRDAAVTYFNLGLAHKILGQREEAQRAIEQAISLARRLKDTHLETLCLAQRGALRDDAGQWGQARADYEQAVKLLDVVGDDRNRAIVKSHQALLYKQQGAYDRAERLMLEALDIFGSEGDPHAQAVLWLNMADLYLSMGLYDQAWDYARRAYDTLARLQSRWQSAAKELMDTLESIPAEEEQAREPFLPPVGPPDLPLTAGGGDAGEPYDGDDLYPDAPEDPDRPDDDVRIP